MAYNNQKQKKVKKVVDRPEGEWGKAFQYKMTPVMAQAILKQAPRGCDQQKYLCDYVNSQCDILGYCELVIIE